MKKSRAVNLRRIASPHPRSISIRKQVSRLGFILLGRLPAQITQWLSVSVRRLHGYWGSSEFSSAFPWRLSRQRLFRRRCIRYSFKASIRPVGRRVNGAGKKFTCSCNTVCDEPRRGTYTHVLILPFQPNAVHRCKAQHKRLLIGVVAILPTDDFPNRHNRTG